MRSHGVTNFPDPSATEGTFGAMVSSTGIDLGSPTVQAALEACKQYAPTQNMTPAQSAARAAQAASILAVHALARRAQLARPEQRHRHGHRSRPPEPQWHGHRLR